jgi:hypothetical protein
MLIRLYLVRSSIKCGRSQHLVKLRRASHTTSGLTDHAPVAGCSLRVQPATPPLQRDCTSCRAVFSTQVVNTSRSAHGSRADAGQKEGKGPCSEILSQESAGRRAQTLRQWRETSAAEVALTGLAGLKGCWLIVCAGN